jgi:hypothetical protein
MNIVSIRSTLFAAAMLCVATGSMGAQANRPRARAKPAMWTALQLTETQKAQVKTIHRKYAPAAKAARKERSDSARRIYDREMTDVRQILTFSQQQTFDSFMDGSQAGKGRPVAKVMPAKIGVPR